MGLINTIYVFIREVYRNRYLIYQLTKRDFQTRYIGSLLGLFWAFAQPIALMLILWFVFTVGLKAGNKAGGVPFVIWFFTAMIAWNFFADVVLVVTHVLHEYAFMVKKVNFRVSVLPIVKILSSLVVHVIFLFILAGILIFNGFYPGVYWFQSFYYLGCLLVLLLGLGWLLSSLNIFTKDVGQIAQILVQFGFWVTPVIWDYEMIPQKYHFLIKLNPVFYITEGYRKSFIYGVPFWEEGLKMTAYFWIVTAGLLFISILVFKKLKPHFADVL